MDAEADAATTNYVYDALPGLTLAFSPEEEEALDHGAELRSTPAAAGLDEDDATETYAVFRNEITAAGDAIKDIPAADFFSLDVVSVEAEAEAEPASPQAPSSAAAAETPSSSRAAEEQPAQGSERAWFRGGRRFRSPMLQLHKEILDFCDFISPSTEEQSSRTAAVQAVSDVVKHIWPQCKASGFSCARTGLYLPTSDIDVVIFESRVKTPQVGLYALAKALSQKGVAKKIQVIAKARVPIVKFVETKSEIAFDISFDVDGGPQAADFIKDAVKKLPALRPLCMILKVFLHQRELNEVYSGGIGSYALLTMLITHLQLIWGGKDILGYHQPKEHNLGILLVKFFDFYGRKLNHYDVGISCNSWKTFFLKSDKDFMNLDRPHLLAIQDPMAPDNDIGKNSFNYFKVIALPRWTHCSASHFVNAMDVKSAFSKAYSVLTDANLITNLGPKRSILGTIVRPDSVLLDRKGWNNEDKLPDMLTEPWEPVSRQFDSENDVVYNWHVIDEDEPLPRNSQSTSEDTSSSPSKKRKSSKSKQKSRKKSKADVSGSSNAANGFREDRASKREGGSSKRRKGPREYDRFTNTLPQFTNVSRW
ncbi:Non-canonical poly(A) RNA polymerase PAPD5 [Dichanthelium oligosanthes]|uniref:polynucleotide adenylyltransferase n=1 Tax=Dichanthelium oligosanthes TaxID=888268 RepID=A0A1E5V2G8_9POAL|nr:Non-canonical poly(A) RNA polymerase PAPD5 [Dichanthelium oligosanthes]